MNICIIEAWRKRQDYNSWWDFISDESTFASQMQKHRKRNVILLLSTLIDENASFFIWTKKIKNCSVENSFFVYRKTFLLKKCFSLVMAKSAKLYFEEIGHSLQIISKWHIIFNFFSSILVLIIWNLLNMKIKRWK